MWQRLILAGLLLMTQGPVAHPKNLVLKGKCSVGAKPDFSFEWRQLNAGLTESEQGFPAQEWWKVFDDDYLNDYITTAFKNNPDYAIARARIEEARGVARKALGQEFPTVELNGNYTRQRNSENLTTPSINQLQGAGPRIFAPGSTVNIYNVPLAVNYELDPFFKKRLATKSKQALAESAKWQAQSVLNSLSSEVATAYFNMANSGAQVALWESTKALEVDNVKLYAALYEAGLTSGTPLNTAKQNLAEAVDNLASTRRQLEIFRNQLTFLLGKAPAQSGELKYKTLEQLKMPKVLLAGKAANMVFKRPDLIAAEYDLKAAGFDVSVARRAYLPSFTLALQGGLASVNLGNLVSPESLLVALTAGAAQTIFSAGTRRADLKIAKARQKEAASNYYKAILKSFQEVEDALASYKFDAQSLKALENQLKLQEANLSLEKAKYQQGLIPYQDVLVAEKQVLALNRSLSELKVTLVVDNISLYKALGGGQA